MVHVTQRESQGTPSMSEPHTSTDTKQIAPTACVCAECGKSFVPSNHLNVKFCPGACRATFHDRERKRGRVLVKLGQAMRMGRNTRNPEKRAIAAWAFAELCAVLDTYNQEDAVVGRVDALTHLAPVMKSNRRPSVDRCGIS